MALSSSEFYFTPPLPPPFGMYQVARPFYRITEAFFFLHRPSSAVSPLFLSFPFPSDMPPLLLFRAVHTVVRSPFFFPRVPSALFLFPPLSGLPRKSSFFFFFLSSFFLGPPPAGHPAPPLDERYPPFLTRPYFLLLSDLPRPGNYHLSSSCRKFHSPFLST